MAPRWSMGHARRSGRSSRRWAPTAATGTATTTTRAEDGKEEGTRERGADAEAAQEGTAPEPDREAHAYPADPGAVGRDDEAGEDRRHRHGRVGDLPAHGAGRVHGRHERLGLREHGRGGAGVPSAD